MSAIGSDAGDCCTARRARRCEGVSLEDHVGLRLLPTPTSTAPEALSWDLATLEASIEDISCGSSDMGEGVSHVSPFLVCALPWELYLTRFDAVII